MVLSEACGGVRDPGCWRHGGPTLDTQEAAEIGLIHINVLNFHLYIVHLSIGLLCAFELGARTEEGRSVVGEELDGKSLSHDIGH